MAGLVNYGSSDEEDSPQIEETSSIVSTAIQAPSKLAAEGISRDSNQGSASGSGTDAVLGPELPLGPVQGPSVPVGEVAESEIDEENGQSTPQSPYSANTALIRNLTLPTVPNYNIPPSPPGSPVPSTNAKFKHFLDLKRKGVHFNEKLAKSAALKNPSLVEKLMDFSQIDEVMQYNTTLSKEVWDPAGFPESAYKEELAKSQKKILEKREEEKVKGLRPSVEFVPASVSGESSRNGTPRAGQKSTAERVMAGLDKGKKKSPQVQGVKRKSRFES